MSSGFIFVYLICNVLILFVVDVKKGRLENDLPEPVSVASSDCVLCYVCRPKEKPGALMIEKCMEFGVPAGPLLGKLKGGQDVTLPNGKLVRAADVRSPDLPSPIFFSKL